LGAKLLTNRKKGEMNQLTSIRGGESAQGGEKERTLKNFQGKRKVRNIEKKYPLILGEKKNVKGAGYNILRGSQERIALMGGLTNTTEGKRYNHKCLFGKMEKSKGKKKKTLLGKITRGGKEIVPRLRTSRHSASKGGHVHSKQKGPCLGKNPLEEAPPQGEHVTGPKKVVEVKKGGERSDLEKLPKNCAGKGHILPPKKISSTSVVKVPGEILQGTRKSEEKKEGIYC